MVTQSRRDDLISLCYFMIYLVDGDLAFLDKDDSNSDERAISPEKQLEEFNKMKKMKNEYTPDLLC